MSEATIVDSVLRPWATVLDSRHRAIRINMAGARAIAQFAGVVTDVRILMLLVWVRLEVGIVATSTIRLVSGRRPDHDVRVVCMTIGAIEIVPVIQRLIGQARVLVDMRSPRIARVTFIAFVVGYEMPCILARRCIAVVAGRTRA